MCKALKGLIEDGRKEGQLKVLVSLVKKGLITLQQAAKEIGLSVEKFEKEAKNLALY